MSNLFQPTALVGAIALAMGFSTSVSAQDSSNVVNASLDTLVVTATRSEEKIKENETLESALRRFKRKTAMAGVMSEIRKREHYEKPSVKRKRKSEAARKRKMKKR